PPPRGRQPCLPARVVRPARPPFGYASLLMSELQRRAKNPNSNINAAPTAATVMLIGPGPLNTAKSRPQRATPPLQPNKIHHPICHSLVLLSGSTTSRRYGLQLSGRVASPARLLLGRFRRIR